MSSFFSVELISFWSDSRENGILCFKFTGVRILHLNQSVVMHLNHKLASGSYLTVLLAFTEEKSPKWAAQLCGINAVLCLGCCAGTSWIRLWWIQKLGLTETGPSCSSGQAEEPSSSFSSCQTRTTQSPTATSSWRNWRDSTLISKTSKLTERNWTYVITSC